MTLTTIYRTTCLAVLTMLSATGICSNEQGNIAIQTNKIQQIGDLLYIDFDLIKSGKTLPRGNTMMITPQLTLGATTLELAPILIKGKKEYKEYYRASDIRQKRKIMTKSKSTYTVIRDSKPDSCRIKYDL